MTNIEKLRTLYDMHSHKAQKVLSLFEFLPYGYSKTIVQRAADEGIEVSMIAVRMIKSLQYKNQSVLKLLIAYAKEIQLAAEGTEKEVDELLK